MRATSILLAAALLAACGKPSPGPGSAERDLRAANVAYDKALVDGDAEALNRFYAVDFKRIGNDAAIHDKADQIEFMTQKVDLLDGRSEDVNVTMLSPDAALLTGRFVGRYRYGGQEKDFSERYSSVWVRQGPNWLVRHEHASLVPDPAPTAN